jgi:hypothetical protein
MHKAGQIVAPLGRRLFAFFLMACLVVDGGKLIAGRVVQDLLDYVRLDADVLGHPSRYGAP